ncbi:MAG: DUF222 domain-containing protein [Ilumatobacteraceae bacterium]
MITAAVAHLDALDVAGAGRPEIEAALREIARIVSWAEAQRARCTRRMQTLSEPQALDARDLVAGTGRMSGRDAQQVLRRSDALTLVPSMEIALEAGRVSPSHVDCLARGVARLATEQRAEFAQRSRHLVTLAAASTPEEFDRTVRKLVAALEPDGGISRFEEQRRNTYLKHWTDRTTGMFCLHGEFDPESGVRLSGRLQRVVERMFHTSAPSSCPTDGRKNDHLQALALLALVDGGSQAGTSGQPTGGMTAEVSVVVDLQTLQQGLHSRSILDVGQGAELPVETIRRMACTAEIIPVVLSGDGVALDVGRGKRLATAAQRRALRAMYPTCAMPNCEVRFEHTVPHHITPWEQGGPSDLANLLPLCSAHHHAVHEGGWKIRWRCGPDHRRLVVQRPGEPESEHGPPRARSA